MKTVPRSIGLACPLANADLDRLRAKLRELEPSEPAEIVALRDGEELLNRVEPA